MNQDLCKSDDGLIQNTFLSIIVPTYMEAQNLTELSNRIFNTLHQLGISYEQIIVDDNSKDGSSEIVKRLQEQGLPVRMIVRHDEKGLSTATIRGFEEARGDVLACMDADLSYPPEALPRLLDVLKKCSADFVIGSRYVADASTDESWGVFRRINSKLATLMARPFAKVKDPTAGFFMLPNKIYKAQKQLNPIGNKIGLELIVKCGCKSIYEVPIHFADRKHRQSKLNFKEQWNYIRHIKRLTDLKLGNFSYFMQFCFVGSTGMLVDLAIYAFLVVQGISLPVARAIGIAVAMSWNFGLNRRITFSYSRHDNFFKQYIKFVGSCLTGAIVSWSIAIFLPSKINIFAHYVLLAAIMGIVAGTVVNFSLSRFWVFKRLNIAAE
jgi:dolichol-phosphate mannosyltransferase